METKKKNRNGLTAYNKNTKKNHVEKHKIKKEERCDETKHIYIKNQI